MRFAALLILAAQPLMAQTCPPAHDISAAAEALIAEVQSAPDEATAQSISQDLWALWARAPDAKAQALLDQGMARRAVHDFNAAKQALDALVAYCPDYAEGYNQRAFVAYLRGEFGAALEDLDRALALSPRHIAAMSGKALTLLGLGRTIAAHGVLREALALNPWLAERALLPDPPAPDTEL